MKIDIKTAKPILYNKFGGMSGPAIKPIAIKKVWDIYTAVKIPIIGVGGISNYQDVIEFLYAGASLCQIGTSIMNEGLEIFTKINNDLERYCEKNNIKSLKELIGIAHEQ